MNKKPITELSLSIISLWWAFVLFFNHDLFGDIPVLFMAFEKVMDQEGWAYIFIIGAALKILGVLLEIFWLRKLGLTFSVVLYGLISAGFILSDEPISTGTGTYFGLCVLALWSLREVHERNA